MHVAAVLMCRNRHTLRHAKNNLSILVGQCLNNVASMNKQQSQLSRTHVLKQADPRQQDVVVAVVADFHIAKAQAAWVAPVRAEQAVWVLLRGPLYMDELSVNDLSVRVIEWSKVCEWMSK